MYLRRYFVTKDMGKPKYFFRTKVAHQKHEILLSQRKYALNLLDEIGLWGVNLLVLQWKPM